jgi:hypothetical protein
MAFSAEEQGQACAMNLLFFTSVSLLCGCARVVNGLQAAELQTLTSPP